MTGITPGYHKYNRRELAWALLWAFPKRTASGGVNDFEAMANVWEILMLFFLSHECSAQCKCIVYMIESV